MKAWQLLEKYGWCQDSFCNALMERCALGAIFNVYKHTEPIEAARQRLMKVANTDNIACWNDSKGRTKRQVINAMKKADV